MKSLVQGDTVAVLAWKMLLRSRQSFAVSEEEKGCIF
jgi:hypothetical protein